MSLVYKVKFKRYLYHHPCRVTLHLSLPQIHSKFIPGIVASILVKDTLLSRKIPIRMINLMVTLFKIIMPLPRFLRQKCNTWSFCLSPSLSPSLLSLSLHLLFFLKTTVIMGCCFKSNTICETTA